jgi:predicted ATP-dependent protease
MDKETLSKYRAEVIERSINVETIINAIICQRYFKEVIKDFYFEVLYDEYFSFGLKRRILEKIVEDIDQEKLNELNRLNNIRNYFAHCNQQFFEAKDIEEKEVKLIEKSKGKVIDPRNINREINFEDLYTEYMTKVGNVEKYLHDIYIKMGGKLLKQFAEGV